MRKFNIHPQSDKWIVCYIWEKKEDMIAFTENRFKGETTGNFSDDYLGCFLAQLWKWRNDELITRKMGELHFVEESIGAGIVAHEIQHFISNWEEIMEWDTTGENFEDVAHLTGHLHSEFWKNYWDEK